MAHNYHYLHYLFLQFFELDPHSYSELQQFASNQPDHIVQKLFNGMVKNNFIRFDNNSYILTSVGKKYLDTTRLGFRLNNL